MQEILPGIHHWTGIDARLRTPVHSCYIEAAGALIDPILPEEGLDAFNGMVRPQQAIATNRRHLRDSQRFAEAFGCKVRIAFPATVAAPELVDRGVQPFWDGDEVAFGITAVEIGVPCDEETALHVAHGDGAVAFGDALVHPPGAPIAYAPDDMLGAHPDRVKRALKAAFSGLLLRDFDAMLFAHGEPLRNDAKAELRRFVEKPVEYPEFGPYA